MQKNGTVSQNLTMMKPAIAIRAIQTGSSRDQDIFYTRAEVLSVLTLEFLKKPACITIRKKNNWYCEDSISTASEWKLKHFYKKNLQRF